MTPKPPTHHDRLLAELRARITGRDWPAGMVLPSETLLAEQHGVSRMTMNKVLGQLAREGYVLRRKRAGTVVASPMAEAAIMAIPDIAAEVAALGLPWRFRLTARALRAARADEAGEGVTLGTQVLALTGIHDAGDAPFCHEARIINPAAAPAMLAVDFTAPDAPAPGAWLLREIPWTSASHRIRAIAAPAPLARALALPTGAACLEVTRITHAGNEWVTRVTQTYAGHAHTLVGRFTPSGAA